MKPLKCHSILSYNVYLYAVFKYNFRSTLFCNHSSWTDLIVLLLGPGSQKGARSGCQFKFLKLCFIVRSIKRNSNRWHVKTEHCNCLFLDLVPFKNVNLAQVVVFLVVCVCTTRRFYVDYLRLIQS